VVMLVTTDGPVDMFVLDPQLGEFVLVRESLQLPDAHRTYSLNEAYANDLPEGYREYLAWAHANGYSSRYIGSMVADVHRTLLKGGVFLYPPTAKAPEGKMRLLYEASPMALLVERAGGVAAAGRQRILDIQPARLHQRTSVILGSRDEVEAVTRHL
jgi:fructose-1,6-bisphosphatase I